jgi:endonuclease III
MSDKTFDTRFTIQFTRTDPLHLQVAEILNKQGRRSKAQYIVNAVLHYENYGKNLAINSTQKIDEKQIETIIRRIIFNNKENDLGTAKTKHQKKSIKKPETPPTEENFEDVLGIIGQNGINTVADIMASFRKK